MPIGPAKFEQKTSPVTEVLVTGLDGIQYEVKIANVVSAVIDTGVVNPIDGVPIFQVAAQTIVQIKKK